LFFSRRRLPFQLLRKRLFVLPLSFAKQINGLGKLSYDEIRREAIALQEEHKHLAIELGENPVNNPIEYIVESMETIYSVKYRNGRDTLPECEYRRHYDK